MARKRTHSRKVFTATTLPPDLHDQIRWLASDLGISVAGLLRWGAMLVLQACGEELPASVAHLRRVPFGGERVQNARETNPEHVTVSLDDHVYAAVTRLAEQRGVGVGRFVQHLVAKSLSLN